MMENIGNIERDLKSNDAYEKRETRMEQEKIYLFMDEKGNISPKETDEPFVLLGVSIKEQYIDEFYQKMIEFKLKLRPDDDPLSWELKGKRGHFDEGQEMELNSLRKTWESFAQFISS